MKHNEKRELDYLMMVIMILYWTVPFIEDWIRKGGLQ
jgi:hypothetical protein